MLSRQKNILPPSIPPKKTRSISESSKKRPLELRISVAEWPQGLQLREGYHPRKLTNVTWKSMVGVDVGPIEMVPWGENMSIFMGSCLVILLLMEVILLLMEEIQLASWVGLLIPFFTRVFIHPAGGFFGFLLWPLPLVYRDWLKPIFQNPYDNQPVNVTTRYCHQVIDGDWKFTQLIPGRWMSLSPYHPCDWYICLHSMHLKWTKCR